MPILILLCFVISMTVGIIVNMRLNRLERRYLDILRLQKDPTSITNDRLGTILEHVRNLEKALHTLNGKLYEEKKSKKKPPSE